METTEVDALEAELLLAAARLHADHAAIGELLVRFDELDGWHGAGIRSLGHWCDINLGIGSRAGGRLAFATARLAELPRLRQAFIDGSVSLDKVHQVVAVATPASDADFTTMALEASTAQLTRICSAYRRVCDDDSPVAAKDRHGKREVTAQPLEDGLVRIVALLEPDEAAIVLAALDARVEGAWRRDQAADENTPPTELACRRADALAELATEGLVEGTDPIVRGERIEVRVHVDAQLLAGVREDGICHIEGVGPTTPAVVRRLMCDSSVCTVTEQIDGIFNLGRRQRTVNRRQRRALHLRDGGCRYPGCAMRRFVDAHHVIPWEQRGPTDMDNLILLCPTHHRLFHEEAYGITRLGNGRFTFHRPDGRPIISPALRAEPATGPPPPGHPRARSRGAPFDLAHTIDGLLH